MKRPDTHTYGLIALVWHTAANSTRLARTLATAHGAQRTAYTQKHTYTHKKSVTNSSIISAPLDTAARRGAASYGTMIHSSYTDSFSSSAGPAPCRAMCNQNMHKMYSCAAPYVSVVSVSGRSSRSSLAASAPLARSPHSAEPKLKPIAQHHSQVVATSTKKILK